MTNKLRKLISALIFIALNQIAFTQGNEQPAAGNVDTVKAANQAPSGDPSWGISLNVNFNTTYLWRGLDYHGGTFDVDDKRQGIFNFAPSINPDLGFWVGHSVGSFYGGLWFSFALTERKDAANLQLLDEVDLYAGTELDTVKGGVFDLGLTFYRYVNNHTQILAPKLEPYIGWKFFVTDEHHQVSDFSIIPSFYYYIDENATSYFKWALDFEWAPLSFFSFNPGITLGYWFRNNSVKAYADDSFFEDLNRDLLHLDINLPFVFDIWEGISFNFGALLSLRFYGDELKSYNINFGDNAADRQLLSINVYWGIGYAFEGTSN